jgi:putative phage-type endonuclease
LSQQLIGRACMIHWLSARNMRAAAGPRWQMKTAMKLGTPYWSCRRYCRCRCRRAADAFAITKRGESEARKKYKLQLLAERLTGLMPDMYVSSQMQWGIDTEAAACERFEEETGLIVQECGFALHDTIPFVGASPDRLVGTDAILECKCPETATHLGYKIAAVPPEKYIPQMLVQLLVTGRKYCYFVSYDPRLPYPHDIFIVKYEPTDDELLEATERATEFLAEVDALHSCLVPATAKNYDLDSDWPVSAPDKLAA